MDRETIEAMIRALKPALADPEKARTIVERFWSNRMALVWTVADVHRAANEREVAVTNKEAIETLQHLHRNHNKQYGLLWETLTDHIEGFGLGRKLTRSELNRFVRHDIVTIDRTRR